MTWFINVLIYDDAFSKLRMGIASAEAWMMFVVVLVLTGLLFSTKKFWVYEDGAG
jgi:multiple sugar transport system permease protein